MLTVIRVTKATVTNSIAIEDMGILLLSIFGSGLICGEEGSHLGRHTDTSRSPAPDFAEPPRALCYLSRSNSGL